MTLTIEEFGHIADGSPVEMYVLDNGRGIELRAISYGGIIISLRCPDRDSRAASIVLGHASLVPYLDNNAYLGAIIGRYANRIAAGRFRLDGRVHQLGLNDGPHHLHGGRKGFDQHVWTASPRRSATAVGVSFSRTSADGEEGYPGTLDVGVSYELSLEDEVTIEYRATTTAPTIVNLTQHTYFDLSAGAAADVLGHELTLDANCYLPVDERLIPLGAEEAVAGTPFDFRQPTPIGSRITQADEQLRRGRGYDHSWVLNRRGPVSRAAVAVEPTSGRTLEVWTTEPAVQFYSGNQLDGSIIAAGDRVLHRHAGFCLETQHYPDSPNHPLFPPTTLHPAQTFASKTVWRLGRC
jgi:aldose 1-epimerase